MYGDVVHRVFQRASLVCYVCCLLIHTYIYIYTTHIIYIYAHIMTLSGIQACVFQVQNVFFSHEFAVFVTILTIPAYL